MHKNLSAGHVQKEALGNGADDLAISHNRHPAHDSVPSLDGPDDRFVNPPGFQNLRQFRVGQDIQNVFAHHLFFMHFQNVQEGLVHGGDYAVLVHDDIEHIRAFNQSLGQSLKLFFRFLQLLHHDFDSGNIQKKALAGSPDNFSVFDYRQAGDDGIPAVDRPDISFIHPAGLEHFGQLGSRYYFQYMLADNVLFLQSQLVQIGLIHEGDKTLFVYAYVYHIRTFD